MRARIIDQVEDVRRDIDKIIIHCSATPEGREHDVEEIRRWHTEGRGWSDIGYHFLIKLDGTVQIGRPLRRAGAHTRGQNANSIGICYVGGLTKGGKKAKDTRTNAQKQSMAILVWTLNDLLGGELTVHGHREFANKACPSFDVSEDFSEYRPKVDTEE